MRCRQQFLTFLKFNLTKLKSVVTILALSGFLACKKSSSISDNRSTASNPAKSGIFSKTTDEEVAEQLMNDYGLHVLSSQEIGNTEFPAFSDYQSAANFIEERQQYLNQIVNSSTSISDTLVVNKFADPPPPGCNHAGFYSANLSGSGGFFSSFHVYFNTSSSGVSTASIYVSGTPIGWSWTQQGQGFNGYCGCVGGTITNGLQIGNITIGWNQSYHFNC